MSNDAEEEIDGPLLLLGGTLLGTSVDMPDEIETPRNRSNRIKYGCNECDIQVWGKPNLNIKCGDCDQTFEAVE